MRVWLIHLGELVPSDGQVRPYRNSILATALGAAGHDVVQWAPTFSHQEKRQRADTDVDIPISPRHRLKLFRVAGYDKNLSLARIRFHRASAAAFLRLAATEDPPDLIVCAMPTPETCAAALHYASLHGGTPVVIDVRDIWPDALFDVVPGAARPALRLATASAVLRNRRIFRAAAGITAISEEFLEWGLRHAGRPRRPTDRVCPMGHQAVEVSEPDRRSAQQRWIERGVDPGKKLICFVGTISRQFDIETVIRAARELKHRDDLRFVLCGSGDRLDLYAGMAADLPTVMFPGWVTLPDMTALMEWSQVALAPYHPNLTMSQAIGNKPFEYMAAGLPIVSSRKGELEVVLREGRCGLTYRAGDPQSLIDSLLAVVDDPAEHATMARNARVLYETRFSAAHTYPAMVEHLERVVASGDGDGRAARPGQPPGRMP